MRTAEEISLFDNTGRRKYVCGSELKRFLAAARACDEETYIFCRLLAFTGCRVSEALAVTPARLDPETGRVAFRTLKRRKIIFRAVPVPPDLMVALRRISKGKSADAKLWPWCRQTAWRKVKAAMGAAGIYGSQAMPKGLRHGFGVANAEGGVPIATTRIWLGHADIATTCIYMQIAGVEERAIAKRLWRHWPDLAEHSAPAD